MAKRKSSHLDNDERESFTPRRSSRRRTGATDEAPPPSKSALKKETEEDELATVNGERKHISEAINAKKPPPKRVAKASKWAKVEGKAKTGAKAVATDGHTAAVASSGRADEGESQFWLMKAEPDSRIENGVDVAFSIDHLAAKKAPEPWDGIRNYVARNNLRAMKKGDLAFFYHSNCKEPGIAGIMEIVEEHSPDLSAHDPKTPYYDASSKPSDPKWSVVHVSFRRKFAVPIGLKKLRELGAAAGSPIANMQMLRQTRLSVSRVTAAEWEYLVGVAEEKEKAAT